jgi:UDP-3-O-[3-hydroxymyristoyl] glucosamine N-acyltransferase
VHIYPGARIGQEGFSFVVPTAGFLNVPQLGRVIVEDDVEVGAISTIDRGSTRDGAGTASITLSRSVTMSGWAAAA